MERDCKVRLIHLFLCLFLALCIICPLALVLTTPKPGYFVRVLSSSTFRSAALNTALECVCSTLLSVTIGYIYAYAVVRKAVPFAKFFSYIPLIHIMTPPFVGGLSFILLLGRNGFFTKTLLGLDVSLYGFTGLLIAQSLCFFPMAYLICSQSLINLDKKLEMASMAMGASKIRTFFKVTLPLSMPGILSSVLFIAVSVMSDFGNPMIVGGRFRVLAVEIYTQLTGWADKSTSSVMGIALIVPSVILFIIQSHRARKTMKQMATLGGRLSGGITQEPSTTAKVLLTVFCSFITLCVVSQFASIIAGSFQNIWGVDSSFTLKHINNLKNCSKELLNSVSLALVAALLSTLVATLCSYFSYRTKLPLAGFLDITAQIPSAVPGTMLGLAYSITSSVLGFHNSRVLIVLVMAVGFLPFSYRIISSSMAGIKTTLDDGARSLGAGTLKIYSSIIMPISKPGVYGSFLYDFVRGVGTMSAVIFLVSFDTPLASVKILNLAEQGFWGDAAALAMVLCVITFAVLGLGGAVLKWKKN